ELTQRTYAKVSWRLLPFLFVLYIVAYLDRVNVSFAQLQMKSELGFSDAVYGLGAGIFFAGYILFEIPSNLILERVGAKFWIARIMIMWGIVSSCMMFVQSETWFYVLRFLLGVGEAGFAPGIILYITYWYPSERRARVFSRYMIALAVSGVVGSPLSGWILHDMNGINGWSGWQWLFLLEGLPAVLLGIVVLWYLDDSPRTASWLTEDEKQLIEHSLAAEQRATSHTHISQNLRQALTHPYVWSLSLSYFFILCGLYGISFWLPQLLQGLGTHDTLMIGILSAVLYGIAACTMLLVSKHSDATGERHWHIAICGSIGALGFCVSTLVSHIPLLSFAALILATCGVLAVLPLFWTLPTTFLHGTAAAAGIACINSCGNIGGFVAPYGIGLLKQATGSSHIAVFLLGIALFIGCSIILSMACTTQEHTD
ncbi:MAG: MFS transporter, partial [Bacteroidota bacterium]|nr:MFS transporter [Candidatus Kapabacteria bacterium]MDW8221297.1 MFS transporter [Bacteroidota bacterium]